MKSYKYAELRFTPYGGVGLRSTDSQVLDWILAELKKVITDFRGGVSGDKLPSGEEYSLGIDRLQDEDFQVGWWILKQLCLQGWEPFAVYIVDHIVGPFHYHLRLEGNAK